MKEYFVLKYESNLTPQHVSLGKGIRNTIKFYFSWDVEPSVFRKEYLVES